MLPTARPIATNQDHLTSRNTTANTSPLSEPNSAPVLAVCFVLPHEQAENLIALLQSITANPPNGSPHIAPLAAPAQESNPTWLTHSEAARYLGVAISTLYRYAEQERIEYRKLANRLEYRRSSLDRFKENQIRPARPSRSRGIMTPTLGSGN
jgi:excisionase family DNA binding protein